MGPQGPQGPQGGAGAGAGLVVPVNVPVTVPVTIHAPPPPQIPTPAVFIQQLAAPTQQANQSQNIVVNVTTKVTKI